MGSNRQVRAAIEQYGEMMGAAASEEIISQIGSIPNIGQFLAVRTKVEVTVTSGTITLLVQGMTEGEAGFPEVKGGRPSADMNLWLAHEFGIPSDGSTTKVDFKKDAGGVTAHRTGAAYGAGSPYVGVIRKKLRSITLQLEEICMAIGGIAGNTIVADIIETGTGGKVQIDRSARTALRNAGVSESMLATLGVNKVSVTSRGQINYLGSNGTGGHFFISGKNAGVPTSINR